MTKTAEAVSQDSNDKRYGIREVFRQEWKWFFGGAVLVFGGFFLLSVVIVDIMPQEYLGRVRVEIMTRSHGFEVFPENGIISNYDPDTFVATEQMVLTSKETLYKVIDELQLVKQWEDVSTKAEAYALLVDKIEVETYPGTRVVDISVLHTDPHESAELANAIARMYRERRNSIESSRSLAALDMLNAQESLKVTKVEDARLEMVELMDKFKIVDLAEAEPGDSSQPTDFPNTGTRTLVIEAKRAAQMAEIELSKQLTLIEDLKDLSSEALIANMLAEDSSLQSDRVSRLAEKSDTLKARLAVLEAQRQTEESAAKIVAVRAEIEFYKEALMNSVIDIKRALQFKVESGKKSLKSLEGIEDRYEEQHMNERKSFTQYMEAKQNYEEQQSILETMTNELLEEKIDLTMPRDPITVHEIAEANEVPASPDVEVMLNGAALLGFALCIPGGLGVMYLAHALSWGRKADGPEWEYVYEDDEEAVEAIEIKPEEEEKPDNPW